MAAKASKPDFTSAQRKLNEELGSGDYRRVYLISGEQTYLRLQNRDKLVRKLYRNRDSFEGTVLAYNYQNGKDEVILKDWDDVLDEKDLQAYLSDQNVMILTYRLPKGEDLGNTPVLSVEMADPKE